MKPNLTRERGRIVLAQIIVLALVIALMVFLATHHRVYGNCHTTPDGRVCHLIKWEGNK